MSDSIAPSLPALRVMLLSALGASFGAACGGASSDADKQTDITDTVVPDTTDPDTGDDDTGSPVIPCADAVPIVDRAGDPSGYVTCGDGAVLRVAPHSWAETGLCAADADCDPGEVCVGDEVAGLGGADSYCIPADCETGADCDSGECGLSVYDDGCDVQATLVCRTDADDCRSGADCPTDVPQCVVPWWSEEVWVCAGIDCAIGRPLVAGAAGQAPITAGLEVAASERAPIAGLDDNLRGALAAWWAHVAQLEHASVASFARVTLELMSLGAPAPLLHGVQAAADDELRHAAATFALASRFAGATLSAGPLSMRGVVPRQGAGAILRGLIREACVGETVGVAEARAALETCTDAATHAALSMIVTDEARHAALAWQTLGWMLRTWPELVDVAESAFSEAIAEVLAAAAPAVPAAPAWGLLSASERTTVREEAVSAVVLPCLRTALRAARQQQEARGCVTAPAPGSVGLA